MNECNKDNETISTRESHRFSGVDTREMGDPNRTSASDFLWNDQVGYHRCRGRSLCLNIVVWFGSENQTQESRSQTIVSYYFIASSTKNQSWVWKRVRNSTHCQMWSCGSGGVCMWWWCMHIIQLESHPCNQLFSNAISIYLGIWMLSFPQCMICQN